MRRGLPELHLGPKELLAASDALPARHRQLKHPIADRNVLGFARTMHAVGIGAADFTIVPDYPAVLAQTVCVRAHQVPDGGEVEGVMVSEVCASVRRKGVSARAGGIRVGL